MISFGSGGKVVVRTPESAGYEADENVLVGNVALYGATSGEAYVNGRAGERFGVRNSGVMTVMEGVGDHGCEYMTGGVAVVLGEVGKNFAAGMSGGEAYLLDPDGQVPDLVNPAMVELEPLEDGRDRRMVRRLVENHLAWTRSARARQILEAWEERAGEFVKVMPRAYAAVLAEHLERGRDLRPAPPPPVSREGADPVRASA